MSTEHVSTDNDTSLSHGMDKEIIEIDVEELKSLRDKKIPIIDVRIPYEWNDTGIIDGAIPILFYDEKGHAREMEWLEQASSYIHPENDVVLVCRTGRRSRAVAEFLINQCEYKRVYNVSSGVKGWLAAGNETYCMV